MARRTPDRRPGPRTALVDRPRIVIVGGVGLETEALTWMLATTGHHVVGVYANCREFTEAGRPDTHAALIDAEHSVDGLVADLRRERPEIKILLLCEVVDQSLVQCAVDHRVEGVALKSDSPEEVILALRHVLSGRSVMPCGWQSATLGDEPRADPLAALGAREREVLDLVACGLSNREIAERLMVSPNTIKFHLRAIYSHLGVGNRVQATQVLGGFSADTPKGDHPAGPEA
jgi:two-component system response regulator DevR